MKKKKIHMIGIGGISMSALAFMLLKIGYQVSGTDCTLSEITKKLEHGGVKIVKDYCPCMVEEADLVVVSGAIKDDNPDLILARKLGKKIISRAQLLGWLCKNKKTIAVAGSHGKTTTSSLIGCMLVNSGLDASVHLGGICKNFESNYVFFHGNYFVTEACEYKESFLSLNPYILVITNQKPDHLDYYKTEENYYLAFKKLSKKVKNDGTIVLNNDDEKSKEICAKNIISFAIKNKADCVAKNVIMVEGKPCFDVYFNGEKQGKIKSPIIGFFNIYNVLAAVCVGFLVGLDFKQIKLTIESFKGVQRREEFIASVGGGKIYHDYAHHPDEIKEILSTFANIPHNRILTIFQPHTYTRTKSFADEFAKSFACADEVWLLPIYPARERKIKGITSRWLAGKISLYNDKVVVKSNFEKTKADIEKYIAKDDLVLILGAGDIENLAKMFVEKGDKNE